MINVLVLGGTTEAREVAEHLAAHPELRPIYSLAGRTAQPRWPQLPERQLRRGGFGGEAALSDYLASQRIDALLDATHPFATRISAHAVRAAANVGIPIARLERAAWTPGDGEHWQSVTSLDGAIEAMRARDRNCERVLLTHGTRQLDAFGRCPHQHFWLRAVDTPAAPLTDNMTLILARGPFSVEAETALMQRLSIDTLLAKNSGGDGGRSKLVAAQTLGVQIIMIERAPPSQQIPSVASVAHAQAWVLQVAARHALARDARPD